MAHSTMQVVDGRYHPECGCFYGIATTTQDCYKPDCHFSSRHSCKINSKAMPICSGIRMMGSPARNPIRISPTPCPNCSREIREGLPPSTLFGGRARR
ncbi:hypothetical protein HYPSUDRAFT_49492 [Hypholoma sublateritium FD-334 SS-4]|uniref:Uncharacterized protein n=1 Tax=Hypholoma sublateritium (strain FD-334 SS-4) TaxID=945553 RepID=A0A0D2N408_HYPSF|nr:hypothetical protein HYPSUDRAFT_49492 [Hypholoma sublateritium FD-334 SS-4]